MLIVSPSTILPQDLDYSFHQAYPSFTRPLSFGFNHAFCWLSFRLISGVVVGWLICNNKTMRDNETIVMSAFDSLGKQSHP